MTICDECPIRLFNKNYNLRGVGNPHFGACIVVPNVDYNAYKKGDMSFSNQVEIIKSVIPSTGELDDLYIVPLLRCNEHVSCEVDDASYNRCLRYFARDVSTYDFKYILLLGDAARRFLHCDISSNLDTIVISQNQRFYNVNYSPLIKYVDEEKFEVFKTYLRKWYYTVKNKAIEYTNVVEL